MRKYSLTTDRIRQASDDDRQKVWDWCKAEKAPDYNTIVRIDLYPAGKYVIYHLATGVDTNDKGEPVLKTMPFQMPIKNKPTWVDLCSMSEV